MCPQRFVPESYDAEKLRVLQQVFDRAWEQLTLQYAHRDPTKEEELRAY
jgi:hypothetical protein